MIELSILIPARNEEWLKETIEDILNNSNECTEIIAVIDGDYPVKPIPSHPRLKIIVLSESIGQRAATNLACKLSKSKYVMKIDAHCAFDKDFDKKLIADMDDNWTVVPAMRNLHVFNWVCKKCKTETYQGPTEPCSQCGGEREREVVWDPKKSPLSTAYRFNNELEFKYWGDYKKKQTGDIVETLSLQGSCFMLTREKYWDLNICDESYGSWGGQGAEVALKTWLSGGEVKVNKKTWYAHLFRTQGKDFSFPYPNPGKEQKKAKNTLRNIFLNDKWSKAKYDLNWLINKFNPVPDWDINKGIIFYTDNKLELKIARKVQKQLRKMGLPITSASLKPMPHFGNNYCVKMKRGKEAYLKQIITALENSKEEIVFFCEHDVLYHPSHFQFTPPTKEHFYFNTNVWKWNREKEYGVNVDDCKQVSGMCCYRELALDYYKNKRLDGHYEPQSNREAWKSAFPNVDIRHDNNMTKNRWSPKEFKNKKYTKGWKESNEIPGWGCIKI